MSPRDIARTGNTDRLDANRSRGSTDERLAVARYERALERRMHVLHVCA